MMKHESNGHCGKCLEIINKYPGFNQNLASWFFAFQMKHPEAHVSCAGRGYNEQYDAFMRGASRAKYGQSAHNFNLGIDLFVIQKNDSNIYPLDWFKRVLAPEVPAWLNWYGKPGSIFYELPHIEVSNWHELVAMGAATLVEPVPADKLPSLKKS